MEHRKVNVERFDAAFRAMLKNARFEMDDACNCLIGSYEKFVLATLPDKYDSPRTFFAKTKEAMHMHFSISNSCFRAWFFPLGFGDEKPWPETIDLTDARACIENVKRIVEKHHGPQDWLPLFPEKDSASGPTLDEFLETLGASRPTQAAE